MLKSDRFYLSKFAVDPEIENQFEVLGQHHTMKPLGQLKGLSFGHVFAALPYPVFQTRV